jgi:hypothetical protein
MVKITAGMLIHRFRLKSPVERACVYAGLRLAMGWAESLFKERRQKQAQRMV